jgi:hypothetical protein
MAWVFDPDLDKPGLNRAPFSEEEDRDLRWCFEHGQSIDEIAVFLCRSRGEITKRIAELGLTFH